jgi:protein-disulfide isomerase
VRLAGEAGLNATAVEGCLQDPKTKQALEVQIAEGNRLEVHATPTVYVDGKKLPRINDFVAVVDKEAQKKGFPPLGR